MFYILTNQRIYFFNSILTFQYSSICRDCHHIPWDKLTTVLQRLFRCIFNSSTAWHFHSHNCHALNVVSCNNGSQFFSIIAFIKLWTSNQGDMISNKLIMKIPIGISCTIRSNQQIRILKIRNC